MGEARGIESFFACAHLWTTNSNGTVSVEGRKGEAGKKLRKEARISRPTLPYTGEPAGWLANSLSSSSAFPSTTSQVHTHNSTDMFSRCARSSNKWAEMFADSVLHVISHTQL